MFLAFIIARDKRYNENIYYRKAQNGIMKTFIIARRKRYNKNIYYRKAQKGHKHVTPPGSGHKNKPTPEGSHVSSICYRKAQKVQ